MKLRTLALAAVLALAPSIASADPPAKQRIHKKQMKRAVKRLVRFERAITRFDQDGDGKLSEAEVGDRFAKLRRFDANGDGWVTAEEVLFLHRGKNGKRAPGTP